jgi:2,3-diketo-5-methylthio-1-phosphopentane phosphatase
MLILSDFDGTATQLDTQQFLAQRFAPEAFESLESKIFSGEMTLHEVLAGELKAITAPEREVVATAVQELPLRAGFPEFVHAVEAAGHRLVILSAGFRQLIVPLMEAGGVDTSRIELIANDLEFTSNGIEARFGQGQECNVCGQACKRVRALEVMTHSTGEPVVYIGDGFSDRCSAQIANRIFARNGLCEYLEHKGVPFERFETFFDITEALQL